MVAGDKGGVQSARGGGGLCPESGAPDSSDVRGARDHSRYKPNERL